MPRASGLGISSHLRSAETFLLLSDISEEDKIRVALGMYALYRTVQTLRHADLDQVLDHNRLMKMWTRKAAIGSKAVILLAP